MNFPTSDKYETLAAEDNAKDFQPYFADYKLPRALKDHMSRYFFQFDGEKDGILYFLAECDKEDLYEVTFDLSDFSSFLGFDVDPQDEGIDWLDHAADIYEEWLTGENYNITMELKFSEYLPF